MTAVMAAKRARQAATEQQRQQDRAIRMATVPRIRLRCELAAAASYSVVSLMISRMPTG
jgi:hypothetical protein